MNIVKLTRKEREMLRRAAELVLAGEWPWEPEKNRERLILERAIVKLCEPEARRADAKRLATRS